MSYRMPQQNTVLHEYDKVISSSLYTKGGIISCWQENILLNQRHQTAAFHGEWDWGKQFNNQQIICPDVCCVQQALKMIYSQELQREQRLEMTVKTSRAAGHCHHDKVGFFCLAFLFVTRERWWFQPKTCCPVMLFSLTKLPQKSAHNADQIISIKKNYCMTFLGRGDK